MDILARDGLSEAALRTLSYRSGLGISGLQTKLGHHGVRKGVRGGLNGAREGRVRLEGMGRGPEARLRPQGVELADEGQPVDVH